MTGGVDTTGGGRAGPTGSSGFITPVVSYVPRPKSNGACMLEVLLVVDRASIRGVSDGLVGGDG